MKTILLAATFTFFLSGCATPSQSLAWGKPGVSRTEYGTDVGMCSGLAVMEKKGPETNTAGGIQGKNNTVEMGTDGSAGQPQPTPGSDERATPPMPTTGGFSGMASADFASRAANAQRSREMTAQRAKAEALKSCLTQRGYRQFALTPQQQAHIATLRKGSDEHLEFLYSLGSDPAVVANQVVAK
jgi:hypothetical protein